jgi:fatty acid desaturase
VVFVTCALWLGMLFMGVWLFRRLPLNTAWGLAAAACWVFVRAGTFLRSFIIMHDALHGALFRRRWMNRWTSIITGLMTATDALGGVAACQGTA